MSELKFPRFVDSSGTMACTRFASAASSFRFGLSTSTRRYPPPLVFRLTVTSVESARVRPGYVANTIPRSNSSIVSRFSLDGELRSVTYGRSILQRLICFSHPKSALSLGPRTIAVSNSPWSAQ